MENMDKEPTVPKWVLINRPKIPQMSPNFWPNLGFFLKKLSLGVRRPWPILLHTLFLYSWERRDRKNKEIDEQLLIAYLFLYYIVF